MPKIIDVFLILLIVLGTPFLLYERSLSNSVTVRNIAHWTGPYQTPYWTHGGTVYVTQYEDFILGPTNNVVTGIFGMIIILKGALSAKPIKK